ncbi:transcriptional regulator, ArsR family [Salinicoccus halodurans]|uniref:ArsR family transcriptional regulator n=2 Tax=Salinicoccus halodurans TaxID=407035 RepID=A0A0F7HQ12_9STAP|nr:ArsR family transcriptional regulator [Salinicoccus halodurans]SFK69884.1 transcriptional regulator, ArsR family [Salinicoccus halodurans]
MNISDTAEIFKVLGDTTRLSMIAMMNKKECCVCDFTECFGMSQPAVSQHLKKLRNLGLVKARKDGYWTYLSLDKESKYYDMIPALISAIPEIDAQVDQLLSACEGESCC